MPHATTRPANRSALRCASLGAPLTPQLFRQHNPKRKTKPRWLLPAPTTRKKLEAQCGPQAGAGTAARTFCVHPRGFDSHQWTRCSRTLREFPAHGGQDGIRRAGLLTRRLPCTRPSWPFSLTRPPSLRTFFCTITQQIRNHLPPPLFGFAYVFAAFGGGRQKVTSMGNKSSIWPL